MFTGTRSSGLTTRASSPALTSRGKATPITSLRRTGCAVMANSRLDSVLADAPARSMLNGDPCSSPCSVPFMSSVHCTRQRACQSCWAHRTCRSRRLWSVPCLPSCSQAETADTRAGAPWPASIRPGAAYASAARPAELQRLAHAALCPGQPTRPEAPRSQSTQCRRRTWRPAGSRARRRLRRRRPCMLTPWCLRNLCKARHARAVAGPERSPWHAGVVRRRCRCGDVGRTMQWDGKLDRVCRMAASTSVGACLDTSAGCARTCWGASCARVQSALQRVESIRESCDCETSAVWLVRPSFGGATSGSTALQD